jgi:hypothetical protein
MGWLLALAVDLFVALPGLASILAALIALVFEDLPPTADVAIEERIADLGFGNLDANRLAHASSLVSVTRWV